MCHCPSTAVTSHLVQKKIHSIEIPFKCKIHWTKDTHCLLNIRFLDMAGGGRNAKISLLCLLSCFFFLSFFFLNEHECAWEDTQRKRERHSASFLPSGATRSQSCQPTQHVACQLYLNTHIYTVTYTHAASTAHKCICLTIAHTHSVWCMPVE